MEKFDVAETFVSINGEGVLAGQLAVFVRFCGCNMNCLYCDTKWANDGSVNGVEMTAEEIRDLILSTGVHNVTLTGGEPLYRTGMRELLELLAAQPELKIEIETNGSISLVPYVGISPSITFTMDYKLPFSGMESKMNPSNFRLLSKNDTVKFVAGSRADLKRALQIIQEHDLTNRCHVYLSPVFGSIEPAAMVEFMQEHHMNGVNLQLQMHKIIWDPDKRGV